MDTRMKGDELRRKEAERCERVVAAYGTVLLDKAVVAAYVVLHRRPTYREMLRFREHESTGQIQMRMTSQAGMRIRAQSGNATSSIARQAPNAHRLGVTRGQGHQPGWVQPSLTMTEGVR